MIGQVNIQKRLNRLIEEQKFPKFLILVGQFGSGKKLLAKQIAKRIGIPVMVDTHADSIRDMITASYKQSMPVVYIIADADNMSLAAKNALLKVTEEPPQNAWFIMTLQDEYSTLDTIRSRGAVYAMDKYSTDEIASCLNADERATMGSLVIDVCETPFEVEQLRSYDIEKFFDYVQLVVDNVAEVSGSNSFKIADKLAVKNTTGYDLALFWKAFSRVCLTRLTEHPKRYASGIRITSKYIQSLRVSSLNRELLFDMWLLDIREEWFKYAESIT